MKLIPEQHTVPDSIELLFGNSSGTVADLQILNDDNVFDLAETTTTPGQELIITFINVIRFSGIAVKAYYTIAGGAAHSVQLQLFNEQTRQWDTQLTFEAGSGMNYRLTDISNFSDYITVAGKTRMRFYHAEQGNATHDTFIEYAALVR